jgi:DNA-binding MarR family transcriptional regulator
MSTLSDPDAATTTAIEPTGMELAEAVAKLTSAFSRWQRSLVGPEGPSYQRMELLYALHCDGPQRMADLASALDVTPRSVTALVDGLEGDGLVRRQPHPTDRRATLIELTSEARAAVDRSTDHQAAVASMFETLDGPDRQALLRLSGLLATRMRVAAEARETD